MNNNSHFTNEEHKRRLEEFKEVLNKITREKGQTYYMFFDECDIDPLYMDSFLSGDNPNFPNPISLKRMAEKSNGVVTYEELIRISGHQKIIFDKEVTQEIKRGDIFLVDFGKKEDTVGSEIFGLHPALIVSNNKGNSHSSTLLVSPITSKIKKAMFPTHVVVFGQNCGLNKTSVILFEQTRAIDKERIKQYVGKVTGREIFDKINRAYRIAGGTWSEKDTMINDIVSNIDNLEENNIEEVSMFKKLYNSLFRDSKSIETLFNK